MGRVRVNSQAKVESEGPRLVAFSKRRTGLFKKASELSALCDIQLAIVVFSEKGKAYTFAHPDIDLVVAIYRNGKTLFPSTDMRVGGYDEFQRRLPDYDQAVTMLNKEKLRKQELKKQLKAVSEGVGRHCGDVQGTMGMTMEQAGEASRQLNVLLAVYHEYAVKRRGPSPAVQ